MEPVEVGVVEAAGAFGPSAGCFGGLLRQSTGCGRGGQAVIGDGTEGGDKR